MSQDRLTAESLLLPPSFQICQAKLKVCQCITASLCQNSQIYAAASTGWIPNQCRLSGHSVTQNGLGGARAHTYSWTPSAPVKPITRLTPPWPSDPCQALCSSITFVHTLPGASHMQGTPTTQGSGAPRPHTSRLGRASPACTQASSWKRDGPSHEWLCILWKFLRWLINFTRLKSSSDWKCL